MTEKQILRKEISREVIDGIETVRYSYHEKDMITHEDYIELGNFYYDSEEAYSAGIEIDMTDEIISIEINNLLIGLADYFSECDDDDKALFRYDVFKRLSKRLQKWRGYTIYL